MTRTAPSRALDMPLAHVRVLDLTDDRGLMAGHLLAQLGADVVQVEPPGGSPARNAAPLGPDGQSLVWQAYCAGKRGVALALSSSEDRARLLDLAAQADVVIDSAEPGEMAEIGLTPADLQAINPRLIHASITAFGSDGPKASYAASDLVVWASSGAVWPHRSQDGVPLKVSADQAFRQAAIDAACAVLIALLARGEDGPGQHIDVSAQASCMLCTLSSHLAMAVGHADFNALGGVQSSKLLDLSGSGARTRKTKWQLQDGLLEMHIGMGTAAGRFSNALFSWIGEVSDCPGEFLEWDWVDVPRRLLEGELTGDDLNRARAFVGSVLEAFSKAEMVAAAQQHGLLLAPVMTTADLIASPQFAARGLFVPLEGTDDALPAPLATGCFPFASPLRPAPRIGEHDGEVMGEWLDAAVRTAIVPARASSKALAGLKVLDLAWVVAGPLIGRTLADFGATVIRVESRNRVETARIMGPFPGAQFDNQKSLLFENANAGKLGLTLDLRTEAARDVVRDLASWADVVIESFTPGQMDRFGLSYETLRAINPRLIMLSSSLMGQTGPNAGLAGFGNIGGALSGFQQLVGLRGQTPVGTFGPYTDYVAPRFGLIALLAALERRRRTGEGCRLDIAQVEGAVALLAPQLLDFQRSGRIAAAQGNRDANHAPSGIFPALGEDRWIAISTRSDAEWQSLAGLVGGEVLAADSRFATLAARQENEDALEALLTAWTVGRDAQDMEDKLQTKRVPAHIVSASEDIIVDPHLSERGQIVRLAHDLMGETVFDAARYRLSSTPARYDRPAPPFGRDNLHVLADVLGYEQERIDALEAGGALA